MKLAKQCEYRGHTLLLFEERVAESSDPHERHWIVIGPDGFNILDAAVATEGAARELVDARLGENPSAAPRQPPPDP